MDDPGPQFIDRLDRDKLEALIETMYLVAFADGDYSESERSHFATSVAGLTGGRIAPQSFDHVIDRVTADLRGGRERCIASLKQRLDDPELRQIALILATDMAAADGILLDLCVEDAV